MRLDLVSGAGAIVDLAGRLESCEVDGFGVDFLSWGFFRPVYWRNYSHTHSFFEVCLGYAGEGSFAVADQHHDVGAGSVFLARPGDVHEIISSRSDPLGIAFWGFTCTPQRGSSPSQPGWWSGLTRTDRPLVSVDTGTLSAVVAALADEARSPRSGHQPMLQALGAALVIQTARAFTAEDDLEVDRTRSDRRSFVVAAMERYLLDNLSRPITVRDVAAEVHLSERHAERLFSQQTGVSVMATLRRLRLERAAQLLLDSSSTVTEVARRCGYPEVRPFSTAFRRQYGQPPLTFRANGGTLHLG
ncbi:AraC family transcriptional regulator [Microlunatus panaciterrae]|uniref:AraC-like DNA-binding protein n=1 Tax=Microlunatus panaciterrae TaxID=400768 RepID=A0ABS2RGN0_9ACTN|nr:AraC family transcriptional regulator [Microlunatus panaciterrae]MBM7797838.1 AraC-like DNA-binding protein [Microlunatus panaciterrae]